MRALLNVECDDFVKRGRGDRLLLIAEMFNQFVDAKIDITVNQFRSIFMLDPHKDERGEQSILAEDVEKPEDKVVK